MLGPPDCAVAHHLAHELAQGIATKLEVDEVGALGGFGRTEEGFGLEGVDAEGLVAEHRMAGDERSAHVGDVQERR